MIGKGVVLIRIGILVSLICIGLLDVYLAHEATYYANSAKKPSQNAYMGLGGLMIQSFNASQRRGRRNRFQFNNQILNQELTIKKFKPNRKIECVGRKLQKLSQNRSKYQKGVSRNQKRKYYNYNTPLL